MKRPIPINERYETAKAVWEEAKEAASAARARCDQTKPLPDDVKEIQKAVGPAWDEWSKLSGEYKRWLSRTT